MPNILIDTDVVIEWLRGNEMLIGRLITIKHSGNIMFYSPVTKAEIFHGLRPGEEEKTIDFFLSCISIPIDDEIGEKAGLYLAKYNKSHSMALGDALIAATCYIHKISLFTLNKKHYPTKDIHFV